MARAGDAPLEIKPATSKIQVDAILDEPAWKEALELSIPWEWAPSDGVAAPVKTRCWITFDETRLYVAFQALDPEPGKIRARFADRDVPFADDIVGFMIDTFNDQRRAYQFRINPLGVQMDAINNEVQGSEDWSWNAIWDSAGRITDDGYIVELSIPFQQLTFRRTDGPQTWRFLATRDYPRSVRHRLRSIKTDLDRNCTICQFQEVAGFQGMKTGRNLELDPTLTAVGSQARNDFPDGDFETSEKSVDMGLSGRWGITTSMGLAATVNPDFSQVEADSAQVDVNRTFALFFPERRPFFLEGADFFSTPIQVVFTRTIADPIAGLKLTGKEGTHAFGAFFALDRLNNLLFPGSQGSSYTSLDQDVLSGSVRYRRDLGKTSALGAIYSGRVADGYGNHLLGADGLYRFSGADQLGFQVIGSSTHYPREIAEENGQPLDAFQGIAFQTSYFHNDSQWTWWAGASGNSPNFRADNGFVPQVSILQGNMGINRLFRGQPGSWFSTISFSAALDATREWNGEFQEWGGDLGVSYRGPLQSFARLSISPNGEHFAGKDYNNLRQRFFVKIQPTGTLELGIFVSRGKTIDFANNQQADFVALSPWIELSFRRFQTSVRYDRQILDLPEGRLFTFDLLQTTTLLHFSHRAFLRAILQFRRVTQNPALFPYEVEKKVQSLLTQLLFTYRLNAQTALLLGYSDNYQGLDKTALTQTDRALFLKASYAILW